MKITTEHCVKAIIKYFYDREEDDIRLMQSKNWKRISKIGTDPKIVRTFENRETGKVMVVNSTETTINKISVGKAIEPDAPVLKFMKMGTVGEIGSVKQFIRNKIEIEGCELHDLVYEIFGQGEVTNWPILKIPYEEDYDAEEEEFDEDPLDLENFEWISINDDELVIACGGDWQEPLTVTMQLVDNKLTVIRTEPGFPDGLSEDEFLRCLR